MTSSGSRQTSGHNFPERIPEHVAIIMDGNGRWARKKGLPRIRGHREGVNSVKEIVTVAAECGIRYLTLYSFSMENWKRPKTEIQALMRILKHYLREELPRMMRENIRFKTIGRLQDLSKSVRKVLEDTCESTSLNSGLTLILALNYGGRTEIVDGVRWAVEDAVAGRLRPDELDEERFSGYLYTREIPDPDLIIRTSGEMRLSNFLLWQASYSELWVTPVLWPEFRKEVFMEALREYFARTRRFGGI